MGQMTLFRRLRRLRESSRIVSAKSSMRHHTLFAAALAVAMLAPALQAQTRPIDRADQLPAR